MTNIEFNNKWDNYLEEGHYGIAITLESVVDYLDKEFEKEVKVNPKFRFSQIKTKFGMSRVYAESNKTGEWEKEVNRLIKIEMDNEII